MDIQWKQLSNVCLLSQHILRGVFAP